MSSERLNEDTALDIPSEKQCIQAPDIDPYAGFLFPRDGIYEIVKVPEIIPGAWESSTEQNH